MEKISKRLRPFFDNTLKIKHRQAALLSYLENATEAEQQKVFRDFSDQLTSFIVEAFNSTIERLNIDKEYYGRFERALTKDSRELEELFHIPFLMKSAIRYLRSELCLMTQVDQLINIIRTLLHPGNHQAFRREGVRLLMFWLRDESSLMPETVLLFASLVPLNVFIIDGLTSSRIRLDQPAFPLAHEEEPPFFPAIVPLNPTDQAVETFMEMLDFITFDVDADRQSTHLLYQLLQQHYFSKLYPLASYRTETSSTNEENGLLVGFIGDCPAPLQAIVMRYFAMWTVQTPELFTSHLDAMPVATFILQDIILGSSVNLELVHKVISQSLALPPSHKFIVKTALGVLRTWIFNTKERRPAFLTAGGGADGTFDKYLCKYIGMVENIFEGNTSSSNVSINTTNTNSSFNQYGADQVELYREGVYFLRGIAMKAFFPLSAIAWKTLLEAVMNLCEMHLSVSVVVITNSQWASEFAQLLSETLFGVWIRSQCKEQAAWERLAKVLVSCTRWQAVVMEWSRVIIELTNLMSLTVFVNIPTRDLDQPFVNATTTTINTSASTTASISSQPLLKKKQYKSGIFEVSNLSSSFTNPFTQAMQMLLNVPGVTSASSRLTLPPAIDPDRKTDNFLLWTDLTWTRENVVFLWRNFLRALGDINAIQIAENHEIAIQCLVAVTDRLFIIREAQPFVWRPLPPLYECALIFLDACDLPARAFERSRCLAYTVICRLFVRRHDVEFPDQLIARFYLSLINGLSDKDDPVASIIILCASNIFSCMSLTGVTMLIPSFVKTIAGMLNSSIPIERSALLVPIMRLILHISILSDVFPIMKIPRIEAPLPIMSAIPITCAGEMNLSGMRMQTKEFLALLDEQGLIKLDPVIHSTLLNVTTVLLINELGAVDNPDDALIDGYLNFLLDHLLVGREHSPCLPIIFDQLFALSQTLGPCYNSKLFTEERQTRVISKLLLALCSVYLVNNNNNNGDVDEQLAIQSTTMATLQQNYFLRTSEQDEFAARFIGILLEWIMALPHDFLTKNHSLREQVFTTLEGCLQRENALIMKNMTFIKLPSMMEQTLSDYIQGSKTKDAAELALLHLSHHLNNFAPISGAASINSNIPEASWHGDDDRIIYFYLEGSAIIAVQHLVNDNTSEGQVRLSLRNAVGRFTWDSKIFFETSEIAQNIPKNEWSKLGLAKSLTFDSNIKIVNKVSKHSIAPLKVYRRDKRIIPIFKDEQIDLEHTDMLKELFNYIGEEHPEILSTTTAGSNLNTPPPIAESKKTFIEQIATHCQQQIEQEVKVATFYEKCFDQHQEAKPLSSVSLGQGNLDTYHQEGITKTLADSSNIVRPKIPFNSCRQLLGVLGFFDPYSAIAGQLKILAKTPAMARDLEGLDRLHSRELIKIAVLYVGPGQEDEISILKNGHADTSMEYEEFLNSLGWKVDLKEHKGYRGGLESGMVYKDAAIYHATSMLECIFHDSSAFLSDERDTKMISKKRHIGNDHIHIIWNEHYREYRPTTIRTDYANAQLIITPLPNVALYKISIFREASIIPFGPLFDGCIIPKRLLGSLIRATAINAHRAVLSTLGRTLPNAMSLRIKDISLIGERHAQSKWTMEQFLAYSLFANNPMAEEEIRRAVTIDTEIVTSTATTSIITMNKDAQESSVDTQQLQDITEKVDNLQMTETFK